MAAGNMVNGINMSVANNGTVDIKPANGTDEWVIHNIYYSGAVSFAICDGTNLVTFDSDTGQGARLGLSSHVKQTQFIRVTNTSGGNINISYDGIQTA
jgi:hypothetical protein